MRRKGYAIHYMKQELQIVERNKDGEGCCSRKSFYKILKVVSKPSMENENAEHCMAIMGGNQAVRPIKFFDEDRWLSFCVLKKALQFKREELVKRLLSQSGALSDRMCLLRVFDTTRLGDFSDRTIWCQFLQLKEEKAYRKKYKGFCNRKGGATLANMFVKQPDVKTVPVPKIEAPKVEAPSVTKPAAKPKKLTRKSSRRGGKKSRRGGRKPTAADFRKKYSKRRG